MTSSYDFKLVFPHCKEVIHTSSQFLSAESKVFQQLISKESPKKEIEIHDVKYTIVFDSLQCLRTVGKSLNNVPRAVILREFAKNYKIKRLYTLCGTFITDNLSAKNIGEVHDLACHYKDSRVQYFCWLKFDTSWKEIFCNPSFYTCSSVTILRCVSRPVYKDMNEFSLWNAVYTWGLNRIANGSGDDKKRTHRDVLMEFLPYIRFLVMKTEELETIFSTSILTNEECNALRTAYYSHDVTKLPSTLCQETTERKEMFAHKYTTHINYFYYPKHSLLRWVKAGDTFYAEFTVKRDCFLRGLLLPLYVFAGPLIGMLELTKAYNSKECDSIDGARKFKLFSRMVQLYPQIFIEENCTVCINVVIMEDNLSCELEPYASCNICKTEKKICEATEDWKSFYINDIVLYF